jgi:Terminase RNaseH-like domain
LAASKQKIQFGSPFANAPSNLAGRSGLSCKKERKNVAPQSNPFNVPIDAVDFIRSCRIRTGSGFQRFDLYDYQEMLLELFLKFSMIIIIKDRQLGITEVMAAFAYYLCLTDPAYSAAFVSINQDKAAEISERIDGMAPGHWGIQWRKNNNSELHPKGCGVMRFLTSTKNAARGFPSVNLLGYDEAGFLEYFTELYGNGTSAQESVPEARRKIILNTTIPEEGVAHPVWGMFASDNNECTALEYVRGAREGGSNCGIPGMFWWLDSKGCCKVVIGHKVHPVYGKDPNYIQSVVNRRKIPMAIAQREHNLGIEIASCSLFNEAAIARQSIGEWAPPKPGRKYMGMVDPNFGGSDNFVTLIFDITDSISSLAAEYSKSDLSTEYSEDSSIALFDAYGVIGVAIESNSGGKIVLENILRKRPGLDVRLTLTTNASKKTNTDRAALAVEQGLLIYPPDWEGQREMRSFSAQHRKASAGEKDDRIMALAAGLAHLTDVLGIQEIYESSFVGDLLS